MTRGYLHALQQLPQQEGMQNLIANLRTFHVFFTTIQRNCLEHSSPTNATTQYSKYSERIRRGYYVQLAFKARTHLPSGTMDLSRHNKERQAEKHARCPIEWSIHVNIHRYCRQHCRACCPKGVYDATLPPEHH